MTSKEKYIGGFLAGSLTTTILHPLDALRVRLFYRLKDKGSPKTFYNGYLFSILSSGTKTIFVFPTQEGLKDYFLKQGYSDYRSEFYGSVGSGILMSVALTPVSAIKIPLQSDPTRQTIKSVSQDIYSKYGLRGFYRGCIGSGLFEVTWSAVYFGLYKYLKENYIDNKTMAAVISSCVATTISYPFDGSRLYRQNPKANHNFWTGFKKAFSLDSANLKAYTISLMRIPLATTLSHMTYLYISKTLQKAVSTSQ